ncbi:MAG: transcriptional repressor, partial [archaeon]
MHAFKHTNQRMEILAFLKHNKSHPGVDEIFKAVKKKLPYISKATVYQNIKFLAGEGLVRILDVNGVM